LGSAGNLIAEVVITLDVLAEKASGVAIGDQIQFQRKAIGKGSQHRRLRFATRVQYYVPRAPRRSDAEIWQRGEPSSIFELLEKRAALVVFEPTRGTAPVEKFTDSPGEFGQTERREIMDDVPDEAELFSCNWATAERDARWHRLLNPPQQDSPCQRY